MSTSVGIIEEDGKYYVFAAFTKELLIDALTLFPDQLLLSQQLKEAVNGEINKQIDVLLEKLRKKMSDKKKKRVRKKIRGVNVEVDTVLIKDLKEIGINIDKELNEALKDIT